MMLKKIKPPLFLLIACFAICSIPALHAQEEQEEFENIEEFDNPDIANAGTSLPEEKKIWLPAPVTTQEQKYIEQQYPWLRMLRETPLDKKEAYKIMGGLAVKAAEDIALPGKNRSLSSVIALYNEFIRRLTESKQLVEENSFVQELLAFLRGFIDRNSIPEQAVGVKKYVDASLVRPGQIRISQAGVQEKVREAKKKGSEPKLNEIVLISLDSYEDPLIKKAFSSVIPLENALPVVATRLGLILIDGHHDFMANQKLAGTTVPIEIKDDLRNLPAGDLWNVLIEKNYVYPFNLAGKKVIPIPAQFTQLEDDPYRFFVKLAMLECKGPETKKSEAKVGTDRLQFPLAIKWKDKKFTSYQGLNVPFIEFAVADQLYKHGAEFDFDYKAGDEKSDTFQEQVEKARALLKRYPVKGFNIIPTMEEAQKIMESTGACAYTYKEPVAETAREVSPILKPENIQEKPNEGASYQLSLQNTAKEPLRLLVIWEDEEQASSLRINAGQTRTITVPAGRCWSHLLVFSGVIADGQDTSKQLIYNQFWKALKTSQGRPANSLPRAAKCGSSLIRFDTKKFDIVSH